jgi:hypothetical protein
MREQQLAGWWVRLSASVAVSTANNEKSPLQGSRLKTRVKPIKHIRPIKPIAHLVAVQGALHQLADLLKDGLLARGGGKHLGGGWRKRVRLN